MHRNPLRSSDMTYASGIIMAIGGVLYLVDQSQTPRNWHLFLIPSMFLMGLGVLLALASAISNRRSSSIES
jgi:predicted membrane channel-forming protein YqfA (hemolysin III family)